MTKQLPSFKNQTLFKLALTHRSYANENHSSKSDNERLEFLGDAILGFVIAEMLYSKYSSINEAQLTHLRSRLVDEKQLGKLGKELGLGTLMHLGKGAAKDGGRDNPSLLNNTFEAILGAYFLDAGYESAREYILEIFQPIAEALINRAETPESVDGQSVNQPQATFIDSKNLFQQWAFANCQTKPQYKIIAESGPDHAKEFTAQVSVLGKVYGVGTDRRKQEAEKRAAEMAIKTVENKSIFK